MCGHFLRALESAALPVIGSFLGGPVGGALGGAVGGALHGGGITGALEGGALGGIGGALSGSTGFLTPADSIIGGLNSGITGAFSPITSGLSSLGNSFQDALGIGSSGTGLGTGLTGQFASGLTGDAADTAAIGLPSTGTGGFLSGSASAPISGGGSYGGFLSGGGSAADDFASGLANPDTFLSSAAPSTFSNSASDLGAGLSSDFSNAVASPSLGGFGGGLTSTFQNAALPSGVTSFGDALGTAGSAASGGNGLLSNLTGNNNLLNGLLKTGLGAALQKDNSSGFNALQGAANQSAANFQPFLNTGTGATNTIANLNGSNGIDAQNAAYANFQNNPGYQFALQQGLQALDASAAAHGGVLSGNQQRAVQDYGSGLASETYNQYLSNLMSQANSGQNAAQGVGSGLLNAANAYSQGNAARADNTNNLFGGLASALFPTNALSIGGIPINLSNANGGFASLFS